MKTSIPPKIRQLYFVLSITIFISCTSKQKQEDSTKTGNKPVDVYIKTLSEEERFSKLVLGGWIEAYNQRFIYSQVSGIVGNILKRPGESVQVGNSILQILPDAAGWEIKPHMVLADAKGRLLRLMIVQGDRVLPGEKLGLIGDMSGFQMTCQATYKDLEVLKNHTAIDFYLPILEKESSKAALGQAKITAIDPSADIKTGTFGVNFDILCKSELCKSSMRPGLLGRLVIKSDVSKALFIEEKHLSSRLSETFAYVLGESSKAEKRVLKIGKHWGKEVEIIEGLKAGDKLITSSAKNLLPGDDVHVAKDLSLDEQGVIPQ